MSLSPGSRQPFSPEQLALLFTPTGTPWDGIVGHDGTTQAFLDQLYARPAGQWVLRRYAGDRQRNG